MPRLAVAAGASWPWKDHMTEPTSSVSGLPRAATIATMASRVETFQQVLPVIHAQVDHVFVYLDGYDAVPGFLQDFDRISVYRAEEVGDLHCSSRFLCLQHLDTPTVVVSVDDDIIYPPDYVDRLVEALHQAEGLALVGVHGRIFRPPHRSYVHDAAAFQFAQELVKPTHVHELGMGTATRGRPRRCASMAATMSSMSKRSHCLGSISNWLETKAEVPMPNSCTWVDLASSCANWNGVASCT